MPYTNEVIRYLRRKDAVGFNEPISWLGAEQRFVGPLRNSNVNNLEEQYVLGTDTYTVTYQDNQGNTVIEKSFCITDDEDLDNASEYYKIKTTIYKNIRPESDVYFDGNDVNLSNRDNDISFGDPEGSYSDVYAVYFLDETKYSFDENGNLQIASVDSTSSDYATSRKDELYFIKSGQADLLVLIKMTEEKYIEDGNKKVVRERIFNALNPS